MSEIKPVSSDEPVYQRSSCGVEWAEITFDFYSRYAGADGFCYRILYPAAAYEALQKENAELKRNHKFTCENLANTVPFIEELEQKNAEQAKRISELEEKLQYRTNIAC